MKDWEFLSIYLKNRSQNTRLAYEATIKDWCRHLGADPYSRAAWKKLLRVGVPEAESYVLALSTRLGMDYGGRKEAAQNTIALRVCILRRIYTLLMGCGEVKSNPFALVDIRRRKGARRKPDP